MADEELTPFQVHVLSDLHDISKMLTELHAELDEFRPVLAAFRPGSGLSTVDKAGLLRKMRKAAKSG